MNTKNIRITLDILDLPDNDFVDLVIRGKLDMIREYLLANGATMVEVIRPLEADDEQLNKIS